ncbi:MAG: SRPBCC family protein [Phycisphaerales bacterium]|nr:SRPBCC family protein [Phycisphaerales bacterium]
MLWTVLTVVAALVGVIALLTLAAWAYGRGVPVEHQASGEIDVNASMQEAFDLIADVQSHPQWAKGVTKVEMLPEKHGLQTCRMHMGRNAFVLVRTRCEPPRVLERCIEEDAHFSGTWLYAIRERAGGAGSGCTVKLTETGRVKHAIPRAMMKLFFGYHMYLNMNLESIGKKLGSVGTVRKV